MAAKKRTPAPPLAPLGQTPTATTPTTTVVPGTLTYPTVAPAANTTPQWIKKRAAAYVVALGLSPAAAKKKATDETNDRTIDAEASDPFFIMGSEPLEGPGSAKKFLAALNKAKVNQATSRWAVPGYGLYTDQEYYDLRAAAVKSAADEAASGGGGDDNGGSSGGGGGREPRDFGGTKPARPVEGDTYTNSKKVKFTFKGGKYVRTAVIAGATDTTSDAWKKNVQEEFGSLWDVYNSDPEVKKVIDDAVKGGYQDDEQKMNAKLQNTSWYRTTQQSARQWAVQQSTDPATAESRVVNSIEELRVDASNLGFTLPDEALRKLATDSIKFGWSPQQKLNALGSEQVANAQLGGAQGMADLRQSSVARNLRAKAAAFFQKPSEEMISSFTQQILTGQKSEVQFEEAMRGSARTQFRSLQPALDKGEDVATAMYAYTQQAK